MSWEAANAPKDHQRNQQDDGITDSNHSERNVVRSSETVEAALARLSRAYTSSLDCIGALSKTTKLLLKSSSPENTTTYEQLATLRRLSTAARTTLEKAILLDPLVVGHVPSLHRIMLEFATKRSITAENHSENNRWEHVLEEKAIPPLLSSNAHKATIRELTYLALVNYSDLLQTCRTTTSASNQSGRSSSSHQLLDRGVVPKNPLLADQPCFWENESEEDTIHLCVASLCDASDLDKTDPTLWLKLACASRRLEGLVLRSNPSTVVQSKHRRLQRLALEQGSQALPESMPPNRAVMRALRELESEPEPDTYISTASTDLCTTEITVDLPRYSWSMLGRLLIRACREGANFQGQQHHRSDHHGNSSSPLVHDAKLCGSPLVRLKLSPMLVLPSRVLSRICLFLESPSIWRFEATCRALSVAIMSARATKEIRDSRASSSPGPSPPSTTETIRTNEEKLKEIKHVIEPPQPSQDEKETDDNVRTSKRLRTQQITSGKIAERAARRKSFSYCFLAATCGLTKDQHKVAVTEATRETPADGTSSNGNSHQGNKRGGPVSRLGGETFQDASKREAQERIGSASLSAFVNQSSANQNSGPIDLLSQYLFHVALHTEDVFISDPGGVVVLASCILSCFELLAQRKGFNANPCPCRFKSVKSTGSFGTSLKLFAVDLLYSELLLRQCDRHTPSHIDFDDDCNIITMMVTALGDACSDLQSEAIPSKVTSGQQRTFQALQIRCKWLFAGYFLWRSRISRSLLEANEAKEEAILLLQEAADGFGSPLSGRRLSFLTPHLVSPGRSEVLWKELSLDNLSRYRNEIQAASVVSQVRQRFHAIVDSLKQKHQEENLLVIPENEAGSLGAVGETLYSRYKDEAADAPNTKHLELVEDFLCINGEDLLQSDTSKRVQLYLRNRTVYAESFTVAHLVKLTNPTILAILNVCVPLQPIRFLELLLDLAITTMDFQTLLLDQAADSIGAKRHSEDDDFFSDSEDESSIDGTNVQRADRRSAERNKIFQCGFFLELLFDIMGCTFCSTLTQEEQTTFVSSPRCHRLIRKGIEVASTWYQSSRHVTGVLKPLDQVLFRAIASFVDSICLSDNLVDCSTLKQVLFSSMLSAITSHHSILRTLIQSTGNRAGRSVRQKECIARAEFIGLVSSQFGLWLSMDLCSIEDLALSQSTFFSPSGAVGTDYNISEATLFFNAVLWLWTFASQDLTESTLGVNSAVMICSSFDRPVVKELRVPVGTLVCALCGTTAFTRVFTENWGEQKLHITDFFDSDDSANEEQGESSETGVSTTWKKHELLRTISHVVYCIDMVAAKIDDKQALSIKIGKRESWYLGPTFPLVATRVLNYFSDSLLQHFVDEEPTRSTKPNLWAEEYPFSTRTVGEVLDSVLHQTYRWLYGFSLVGEKAHLTTGKDPGSALACSVLDLGGVESLRLENVKVAAQLYRCIVRAYDGGRRSPPKAALELVSSALPPLDESERSDALKQFLFRESRRNEFSLSDITKIIENGEEGRTSFETIHQYLLEDTVEATTERLDQERGDILLVRKGILSGLASGPLPTAPSDSGRGRLESSTADDERHISARTEDEISKKFLAIVDDLCLGGSSDVEGWYNAAQCVLLKADLIADRVGFLSGYARTGSFSAPKCRARRRRHLSLEGLNVEQSEEQNEANGSWIDFLGSDLSLYMRYSWSSLATLEEGANQIGKSLTKTDQNSEYQCWRKIQKLHASGKHLQWHQAWGGLYVGALRHLAERFLLTALYTLRHKTDESSSSSTLVSEIMECLGISLYSQLMGSQVYGYPIHYMPSKRKRDLARTAMGCFQAAADEAMVPTENSSDSEDSATWDLLFMIGKCNEKIAGTFNKEAFEEGTERAHEKYMRTALSTYKVAYEQALKIEDGGGFMVEQSGGSAHGSTEVMYRLLASRLQLLIGAVSSGSEERDLAEGEALRLVESHWFNQSDKIIPEGVHSEHTRNRVWNALADIVTGLVQCRSDHQFFHRSVYRHAQALMWAPVLHNPECTAGSMGTVPASKSCQIGGLKSVTNAATSAEAVISVLFDKRRAQLCAVWVTTTPTSSPFQVLNNSARKYDSLRGKYASAYVETLRLCRRMSQLETFLKLVAHTKRDLPSFFQASALLGGKTPDKAHLAEPLLPSGSLSSCGFLRSVKRLANSAFADVIIHELTLDNSTLDDQRRKENLLRLAYACYLRLNCSEQDLQNHRAWKYGNGSVREAEALCQTYICLEGDGEVDKTSFGDWSGGARKSAIMSTALQKCKSLFPTVSGNFFSKKAATKAKKKAEPSSPPPTDNGRDSQKRKSITEEKTTEKSFEVAVPHHLSPGDTFLTSVLVGDDITKNVKLTVPEPRPATLRFALAVPISDETRVNKKLKSESTEDK